jgi:hypothetical protein
LFREKGHFQQKRTFSNLPRSELTFHILYIWHRHQKICLLQSVLFSLLLFIQDIHTETSGTVTMVKLTVLLIRHGEAEDEALKAEEERAEDIAAAAAEKAGEDEAEPPSPVTKKKLGLAQRLDPALSHIGFMQAGSVAKFLLAALTEETETRKMALFSAPLKSCTATSLMVSTGGVSVLSEKGKIKWGVTMVETNSPPTAIPCVVQNGLCNGTPEVKKLGGDHAVIAAGLFHCAAASYNNASSKCPFMGVVKVFKDTAQEQTRLWLEGLENYEDSESSESESVSESSDEDESESDAEESDEDEATKKKKRLEKKKKMKAKEKKQKEKEKKQQARVERQEAKKERFKKVLEEAKKKAKNELRRVDLTQFLRVINPEDPYSLRIMAPKVSLAVDYWEPDKYKFPPRTGSFDPKKQDKTWKKGALPTINQSVWLARQTGCDTVIMVVPSAAMQQLAQTAGWDRECEPSACCVASFVADVDDSKKGKEIDWHMHGFSTLHVMERDPMDVIPPFTGEVDILTEPPVGEDPQAVASSKWAAFPPPEPEALPRDYPDLPDFCTALEVPAPTVGVV